MWAFAVFYVLILVGYAGLAQEFWAASLSGEPWRTARLGTSLAEALAGAAFLAMLFMSARFGWSRWVWVKVRGPFSWLWWFVMLAWWLPLPAAMGVRLGGQAVLLWMLSLLPVFPLNRANYKYWAYWTGVMLRSFVLYFWACGWVGYVMAADWRIGGLAGWWGLSLLLGVMALTLLMVYLLEYRVDWAALQREVEARTGASSASA